MSGKSTAWRSMAVAGWMAAAFAAPPVTLVALPAAAMDGEILINQAKVNAGGITPGDTAGFAATLSRPGRYKLTSNLVVPAGAYGIVVTANDVSIDLNGFTISSNPPGAAQFGIYVLGKHPGLRAMNGTITGFGNWAVVAADAVIENMRILSNGGGIIVGENSQVFDNLIANSVRNGVSCVARCVIERNVVVRNGTGTGAAASDLAGINIRQGGALVRGSVIVGNGTWGLVSEPGNPPTGYGDNVLIGNNGGAAQVAANVLQLHPNVCDPACP
jgi:hypothetical protein